MSRAPGPPSCLVADDHPALRRAICDFLAGNGYAVIGPGGDGAEALELARAERPPLALVDLRMPRLSGPALIAALCEAAPGTRVVVYTADADADTARDALEAGAAGLVLKEAPLADLARALASVHGGGSYVDPGVVRRPGRGGPELTRRELEVLGLIAEGLPHEEIGVRLGIGAETVRTHMRKACARLGVASRTQAVATALRLGLIE